MIFNVIESLVGESACYQLFGLSSVRACISPATEPVAMFGHHLNPQGPALSGIRLGRKNYLFMGSVCGGKVAVVQHIVRLIKATLLHHAEIPHGQYCFWRMPEA
jgi:hypothetical protein